MTIDEAKKRMNFEMESGIIKVVDEDYSIGDFPACISSTVCIFRVLSKKEALLLVNFLQKLGYQWNFSATAKNIYSHISIQLDKKYYYFCRITNSKDQSTINPFPDYLYEVEEIQGFL